MSVVGTVAASGTHCGDAEAFAAAVVVAAGVDSVAVDEGKGERRVGVFLAAGVQLLPRT